MPSRVGDRSQGREPVVRAHVIVEGDRSVQPQSTRLRCTGSCWRWRRANSDPRRTGPGPVVPAGTRSLESLRREQMQCHHPARDADGRQLAPVRLTQVGHCPEDAGHTGDQVDVSQSRGQPQQQDRREHHGKHQQWIDEPGTVQASMLGVGKEKGSVGCRHDDRCTQNQERGWVQAPIGTPEAQQPGSGTSWPRPSRSAPGRREIRPLPGRSVTSPSSPVSLPGPWTPPSISQSGGRCQAGGGQEDAASASPRSWTRRGTAAIHAPRPGATDPVYLPTPRASCGPTLPTSRGPCGAGWQRARVRGAGVEGRARGARRAGEGSEKRAYHFLFPPAKSRLTGSRIAAGTPHLPSRDTEEHETGQPVQDLEEVHLEQIHPRDAAVECGMVARLDTHVDEPGGHHAGEHREQGRPRGRGLDLRAASPRPAREPREQSAGCRSTS